MRVLGVRVLFAVCAALIAGAGVAHAETVAVLQGLDKTTARISTINAPLNKAVRFGTLVITARACNKAPPEEPPNTNAFLEIDEIRNTGQSTETRRIYSGWMFATSPAIASMEDPIYDVTVLDCRSEATAAPSNPSSGK